MADALQALEKTLPAIAVRVKYIEVAGSFQAGVLLSQLAYWWGTNDKGHRRLRVKHDGVYWLARKRTEWLEECGLSPKAFDTALARLVKLDLVQVKRAKFAGLTIQHLHLDVQRLVALCTTDCTEWVNSNLPVGENSYTETTDTDHKVKSKSGASSTQKPASLFSTSDWKSNPGKEQEQSQGQVEKSAPASLQSIAEPPPLPRAIDDWVADRPGLAEQKLKTQYTATEWKMKASEILKRHREGMTDKSTRLTANSLAMLYKRVVSEKYQQYVPDLTHKQIGQLKQFLTKVGEESPQVLGYVLENWNKYALATKADKGLGSAPEKPVIGFILTHLDVAVNLYRTSQKVHEPQPSAQQGFDKATTEPQTTMAKEEPASLDEVLAILSGSQK